MKMPENLETKIMIYRQISSVVIWGSLVNLVAFVSGLLAHFSFFKLLNIISRSLVWTFLVWTPEFIWPLTGAKFIRVWYICCDFKNLVATMSTQPDSLNYLREQDLLQSLALFAFLIILTTLALSYYIIFLLEKYIS